MVSAKAQDGNMETMEACKDAIPQPLQIGIPKGKSWNGLILAYIE